MVSYQTVNGEGILKAFRPDSLQVEVKGRWQELGAFVAVSTSSVGGQECAAVLNPKLIQILV